MNIKRNIIFTLESRKKDGVLITENVPIRMRVNFASKRIEFTTGYRIDATKWNADKQRVKNGCSNKLKQSASEINASLLEYYTEIQSIFKRFEVEDVMPTPEQIKEAFNALHKPVSEEPKPKKEALPCDFFQVFDDFVEDCGRQSNWTDSTFEKFAAVKNHLTNFREGLTFEFFDERGLNDYVGYLRDVKEMRNTTIGKQLSFLKWFLRWAFKKGVHQNNAYDSYKHKLKSTQKKIIFLTWDELNRLREFKIPFNKQALERVRDVFLFQCFTGLRYSDVFNLRRSDIKGDHIEVTTVKTSDSLIIELNNHKAILDKYKDVAFEYDKVLPVITNQKMNDYLKELAELAGIDEPIRQTYYKGNERIDDVTPKYALLGTHAGRRTFICNALALGIPPQVVMKWTGHSDYKAMKPYIDITDDIKANAMSKFNQL